VLKPGGLLVSVDGITTWPLYDRPDIITAQLSEDEAAERAPAYSEFRQHLIK
jgi:hypothetical protein